MVRARLHIICGNCGSNDMFKYSVVTVGEDPEMNPDEPDVRIYCENCSTIHNLKNNAEYDNEK